MKRHIITAALLATTGAITGINAQTAPADTVAHITDASKFVITESPEGISVKVTSESEEGLEETEIYSRPFDTPAAITLSRWTTPLSSSRKNGGKSRWDLCIGGPGIGWIDAVGQPDGLGIEMGKSLEISWLNAISVKYSPWKWGTVSIGFGFDWRNYRISTADVRFIPIEGGTVGAAPYPADVRAKGSRLKVFSMGIPVLWTQSLPLHWLDGRHFNFSLGAVFNYNSHGSLLTRWVDSEGRNAEQKSDHIGHRRFSIDLMGIVKIGWGLSAYVRYSPQTVLRGAGQPEFKPFSTGLILMY